MTLVVEDSTRLESVSMCRHISGIEWDLLVSEKNHISNIAKYEVY